MHSDYTTIRVSAADGIGHIMLDRPRALNAFNAALMAEVTTALRAFEADRAIRAVVLSGEGRMVNVTLCFSVNQAILAAKAGATFISPFVGRLDDINLDGMELIADIRTVYDNYGMDTQILAASIRSVNHVAEAARIGADVMTAPPAVIKAMASHPLTDRGLEAFMKDWAKTGQKIL